jgi:hypothetical protein
MIIQISKADLLKGRVLPPTWYKMKVMSFESKPTADKTSVNYIFNLSLPDQDDQEIPQLFNSKALGFMAPFLCAVFKKNLIEMNEQMVSGSFNFDPDETLGKMVFGLVKNEEYQGRILNKIENFLSEEKVPF